ncbi:MAG: hypothetical protein ACOYIF_09515 [Acetivibrionales bacterium]|jgi:flagellar basal body-associated protein FliL
MFKKRSILILLVAVLSISIVAGVVLIVKEINNKSQGRHVPSSQSNGSEISPSSDETLDQIQVYTR